jgi:hypothetical protein
MQGRKGGTPSVPDTSQGGASINRPNGTIYIAVTTGSGLKYYDLYNSSGNLYVKNNENYPYLMNNQKGSAVYAGANIMNYNKYYIYFILQCFSMYDNIVMNIKYFLLCIYNAL